MGYDFVQQAWTSAQDDKPSAAAMSLCIAAKELQGLTIGTVEAVGVNTEHITSTLELIIKLTDRVNELAAIVEELTNAATVLELEQDG